MNRGSALHIPISWVIIGAAQTPSRTGYWLVGADGGVFTYGSAHFYGSTGNIRLNSPVNSMAVTKSGHGYWLIAWDGGVFSFGDARFHGSTGNLKLNVAGRFGGGHEVGQRILARGGRRRCVQFRRRALLRFGGGFEYFRRPCRHCAYEVGKRLLAARVRTARSTASATHTFHGAASNLPFRHRLCRSSPTQTGNGYWLELANGQVKGVRRRPRVFTLTARLTDRAGHASHRKPARSVLEVGRHLFEDEVRVEGDRSRGERCRRTRRYRGERRCARASRPDTRAGRTRRSGVDRRWRGRRERRCRRRRHARRDSRTRLRR